MKTKLKEVSRNLFLILFVAFAYFVFAKLGLLFPIVKEQVTLIWAPSGIALASMLILGYRIIPAIFLGAFLNNITTSASWEFAATTAIGNPAEAILAYYLL